MNINVLHLIEGARNAQGFHLAIHEADAVTQGTGQVRHHGIGEGGEDDLGARLEPQGLEDEAEAGAAGGDRHCRGHTDEPGELPLEPLDVVTLPELSTDHPGKRAEPAPRGQVNTLPGDRHEFLPVDTLRGRVAPARLWPVLPP